MISRTITLSDTEDIKTLCSAASSCAFDVDILSGNYIVDAKSIMGIFALDRSQPVSVCVDAEEPQADIFFTKIEKLLR